MYYRLLFLMVLVAPIQVLAESKIIAEDPEIIDALQVKIRVARHMAMLPTIVSAVATQNKLAIDLDEIKKRDKDWRSSPELTPIKIAHQENNVGRYLQRRIKGSSSINEIFVTDNQGANVAAYPATSDYWQGDEAKWEKSFNNGDGIVYIGPVKLDESTNTTAVQISTPIISRGKTLGVLVMGVTLDYLAGKK